MDSFALVKVELFNLNQCLVAAATSFVMFTATANLVMDNFCAKEMNSAKSDEFNGQPDKFVCHCQRDSTVTRTHMASHNFSTFVAYCNQP